MAKDDNPTWWTSERKNDLKFPYLARQINGPVSGCLGFGIDYVYEKDLPFIEFLSRFSIDNLSGEWLDRLGVVMGLPRPWANIPLPQDSFQFDSMTGVLDPVKHNFSTDHDFTDPNTGISYSMLDGGLLYDVHMNSGSQKVSDSVYREYLKAAGLCKRKHSIIAISDVVRIFAKSYLYSIRFRQDIPGDIYVLLSGILQDYEESLQSAFNAMFTTEPKVDVIVDADFEKNYIQPEIQAIADEVTGDNLTSISYYYRNGIIYFIVELDPTDAQYKDELQNILDETYSTMVELRITVTVGEPELMFDFPDNVLDGKQHGYSTDVDMTVGGEPVTTNDGGYFVNET